MAQRLPQLSGHFFDFLLGRFLPLLFSRLSQESELLMDLLIDFSLCCLRQTFERLQSRLTWDLLLEREDLWAETDLFDFDLLCFSTFLLLLLLLLLDLPFLAFFMPSSLALDSAGVCLVYRERVETSLLQLAWSLILNSERIFWVWWAEDMLLTQSTGVLKEGDLLRFLCDLLRMSSIYENFSSKYLFIFFCIFFRSLWVANLPSSSSPIDLDLQMPMIISLFLSISSSMFLIFLVSSALAFSCLANLDYKSLGASCLEDRSA